VWLSARFRLGLGEGGTIRDASFLAQVFGEGPFTVARGETAFRGLGPLEAHGRGQLCEDRLHGCVRSGR
jgi:hypothetical protein